ncbi:MULTISPECIES: oxygen-independent coproporphyrinogen III oxidase [unclassified Sulfitobacter]|jgi:oxygen-independent coproporphyrinogen-3 oxidase|uniref:oxygen-independent coproporphyrinogen III oxidase n=1 Tax=unclassified Sulfitobacter TaxID=196795 RepID=UPI001593CE7C|nr:oxygen-independent coproporphyrinogen III oxidase [Sulfitobacter sp. HGT1]
MTQLKQLRRYGIFDAKVPRYTSYPPANHFGAQVGQDDQSEWLRAVPDGASVSLYVHVPFCKRLCWFCACRTQGTTTLRPVEAYVGTLLQEIDLVRARLPGRVSLSRLHLGGGTPTILTPDLMARLLDKIFEHFDFGDGSEFSVEIDPTEASPALLDTLLEYGMNRASIGVQDFDPRVQKAIGRLQSFQQTSDVVHHLKSGNLDSLNMDLLYGLPFQTHESLSMSLQEVMSLQPDRLALYGYAHVPWMSKRQVLIDESALPDPETRFELSELARVLLTSDGFEQIGFDHFARPGDGLSIAKENGHLRRNFQGYTDDTAEVLIGLGASAISKFPQGYSQNQPATAKYVAAIEAQTLAGARGHALSDADRWIALAIEQMMCGFQVDIAKLQADFPAYAPVISTTFAQLATTFPLGVDLDGQQMKVRPGFEPLVRILAGQLDAFQSPQVAHSSAI